MKSIPFPFFLFTTVFDFFSKDPSRRNSPEMDGNGREMFVVIPRERKMVSGPAIYDGMLRLSFLLEACQPGTIPDANLIAAVLDLVGKNKIPTQRILICIY
jgi:hypothetical protein